MRRLKNDPGLWIALLFVLAGLPFIPLTGIHADAAAEVGCFYPCAAPAFATRLLGSSHRLPLMVFPYVGAFKAWLYQPILRLLDATPFTLRLPTLLVGAGSVWMFFALLERVGGRRAAVAGALLLATDVSFLLATTYDFGPIAFLHFLMLAGILLLLRFEETQSRKCLALAFFLFGLALWQKAIFAWMLAGLCAGAMIAFPGRTRKGLSFATVSIAIAALLLGASPLLYYNLRTRGATFRTGSVMVASAPLSEKAAELLETMRGSALSGFLTEEAPGGRTVQPSGLLDQASVALSHAAGDLSSDWMPYAFLLSGCLIPWLWFTPMRRPAIFAVAYLAAAWGAMIALPNTGASLHHVILLWPFPHFLVAIALAQASARLGRGGPWMLRAGVLLLVASNVLLLNQYYARLVTRGPTAIWTDAVYRLSDYLARSKGSEVYAVDWGYAPTLCLLSGGRMPVRDISFALHVSEPDEAVLRCLVAGGHSVFVGHAEGSEQFAGVHRRLDDIARGAGYSRQVLRVIDDRNQRPRFEVVRYVK